MTRVFATAADARYGYHLVNLLGSVRANSDVFDRLVAHDLGLEPHQRRLLDAVPGVEVREVPPFAPHWRQGFTWKPWIWLHLGDADEVFYLDAGATVLRSLEPALAAVARDGYFLVSQGPRLDDILPPDYFELYGLDRALGAREYAAAGIIGFRASSPFFERVLRPTYEDCLAGRSLGFSPGDLHRNYGLAREDDPPLRDCPHFRWDQSVLNARIAGDAPDAAFADSDEYAGVRSPREHPRQVIWAHRAPGRLVYLRRIPYTRERARLRLEGARVDARWWLKLHDKYLRRSTYAWKARKLRSRLSERLAR